MASFFWKSKSKTNPVLLTQMSLTKKMLNICCIISLYSWFDISFSTHWPWTLILLSLSQMWRLGISHLINFYSCLWSQLQVGLVLQCSVLFYPSVWGWSFPWLDIHQHTTGSGVITGKCDCFPSAGVQPTGSWRPDVCSPTQLRFHICSL